MHRSRPRRPGRDDGAKTVLAPDALGLATPPAPLRLAALVLLERGGEHRPRGRHGAHVGRRDLAHDRPRERLLREGPNALSDAELVAILLGTGGPGRNVVALAQDVLARCGGVAGLARWGVPELARLDAVGPAKASRLVAAVVAA